MQQTSWSLAALMCCRSSRQKMPRSQVPRCVRVASAFQLGGWPTLLLLHCMPDTAMAIGSSRPVHCAHLARLQLQSELVSSLLAATQGRLTAFPLHALKVCLPHSGSHCLTFQGAAHLRGRCEGGGVA